ncbi:hypothetical protein DPMN_135333 [Dreissena polymorpha]|uniref:Uncharacterized protein n=1 Tax=Dreissena polymorpha TaxID=45954 RepID=A0A9D4G3Q4_DREPO|nr:hypothetical protein DPMN_135333 [Dreissena polymorpha]
MDLPGLSTVTSPKPHPADHVNKHAIVATCPDVQSRAQGANTFSTAPSPAKHATGRRISGRAKG